MSLFWQIVNNLPQPSYCEKVADSILLEPLNVITNLAFFVSAIFTHRMLRKNNTKGIYYFFPWLIFLIGLGSTSWHLNRNPITLLFDAVPIYVFLGLSLFLLLKKLVRQTGLALGVIGLFVLLQVFLTTNFSHLLNSSIRHIANAILLSALIIWVYKKFGRTTLQLIFVFLVYIVGIIFRTIDISICPAFNIGTHFLWHLFVAWGAYLIVGFLVRRVTVK